MRNKPTIKREPIPKRKQDTFRPWGPSLRLDSRTNSHDASVAHDWKFLDIQAVAGGEGVDAGVVVVIGVRVLLTA
jgi:hypothetical protein